MRNALGLTTLLLATASFAGCVDTSPEATLPTTPVADPLTLLREIGWGLEECNLAVGIFGVAASKVQPHVPPGFTVMAASQVVAEEGGAPTLPPNPSNDGNFGIEMFTCKSGAGLDGPVTDMVYGSLFTAVIPPQDLRVAGAKHAFVKWDVLVPDEDRRTWLLGAGVPAVDGKATFSSFDAVGPGFEFKGDLILGEQTYAFSGAGLAPVAEDGSFVEYTATPAGLAQWFTRYVWTAGTYGEVEVTVPASGLAADVLGPGLQRGAGFVGQASFVDGTFKLPAVDGQ